jgi:pimeloyl-ACP methyl ester carboxylesterase
MRRHYGHPQNPDLARHVAGLFRHVDLQLVEDASHWPQWDQPELVAQLIKQATSRTLNSRRTSHRGDVQRSDP